MARTKALVKAGVDAIVVDTAHGHSKAVLDVIKNIKKSFKNIAKKEHPDRGGNERIFKEANEAYDTLTVSYTHLTLPTTPYV